jgi:peptidoglycan/xylan/chitin deacetylase (PgdA/CDA1 family)
MSDTASSSDYQVRLSPEQWVVRDTTACELTTAGPCCSGQGLRRPKVKHLLKNAVCQGISWAGMMPVVSTLLADRAVILMFHEVQEDCPSELLTGTPIALFEYALKWLKMAGWDIVSLDDCLDRLATNDQQRRNAVLSFDDGYRDNVLVALPILERHNAPFTMYIPTGAPKRTLQSWWLGLRELFRSRDRITIEPMGMRFYCPDARTKAFALREVTQWVHADYGRVPMLAMDFVKAGIALTALNDKYFLDEQQLQTLARHPLASIGGHTTSHAALKNLEASAARTEMADNRYYLEDLLQVSVRHFAYPYGGPRACGPREEGLARAVGFRTAVTTRHGQFGATRPNHFALPRIGIGESETMASVQARISGLQQPFERLLRPLC